MQQDLAQVETDIHYNFSLYKNELSAYSVPKSAEELVRILYDFTEKSESLSTEYNSSKNDLQQIQNNLAADEALLLEAEQKVKTTRNNCVELESKLEEYDKLVIKVNQLCESKELQGSDLTRTPLSASIHEKLDAAKCAEEEARSNVTIASSGLIFAKRLRKIRQKNGNRCPCCTQEMSPELIPVFDENVQKISDFVDVDTFGTIDDLNRIADEASACYSAMQGLYKLLLPLDEMHLTIVDGDIRIQQLKEKCDNYRKQIHKREAELLTMNTNKTSCAKVLSSFQTLQNTWQSLERRSADLTNNKKRLSQLLVFSDLGNRSINELEQQHRQHLEEKDSLQSKKDALQMEATKLTNKYFSIQTLLAEKERQVNEAKLSGNTYGEIENQIKVLLGRSTDAEISRTALESSQLLISTEVKDLLTELEKLKSDLKQKENVHNSKMICFQDDLDSLMKCRTTIDDIEQQYRALDINNMEDELDKAKQTAAHTEVRIKDLNAEIHSINTDLLKQSQDKKNVINNIDVLNLRRERDQLAQQLNELINEYPDGDLHDFLNDAENNYKRKQREKSDLMSKRDVLKGKAVVYLNQIDDIKSKLNSSTYKDVEKQHRQKFIEYETTMIAVSDLDSYHNAL